MHHHHMDSKMNDSEAWRSVVGFEGFYEVSNFGRVRTVQREVNYKNIKTRTIPSKIRSTNALLKGYPAVNLSKEGKTKMRLVHVMVLEAFEGPKPTPAHEGCHADGNPLNNVLDNLRWGTRKENKADQFIHGTAIQGERMGSSKLTNEIVRSIRSDARTARPIAAELGLSASTIQRARNGRTWKHVE
jgi:hypothetical protein